jgi:hypothetical protein
MTEQTGLERYRDWLKKQDSTITTRTKAFFKDLFFIQDRRENEGLELPPDVIAGRRWNDSLHQIEKDISEIKADTKKSGSILRTWASMIRQGAKDLRD